MKRILFFLCLLSINAFSNTWNVGPARTYTSPDQVVNLVQDADTILIDYGMYNSVSVKWNKKNLVFIGLLNGNNRPLMQYIGFLPNQKGIFVFENGNDNPYIEGLTFYNAMISDADGGNGAGIRFQARNLTVKNCKFENCQNGILEGNGTSSGQINIVDCEFTNCGYQNSTSALSGYEHSIYIGASADTLLVRNCYFHDPRGQGNLIKTRAQRSFILYNYINEGSGDGSYEINIAQGGLNIIMGNIIIQGTSGSNHTMIGYDAVINNLEDLYVINNTFINNYQGTVRYFNFAALGVNTFKVYNNIFGSIPAASTSFYNGSIPAIDSVSNLIINDYTSLGFSDVSIGDFTLTASAVDAIDRGTPAGSTTTGFSLTPDFEIGNGFSALNNRTITGNAIDIGAHEYGLQSQIQVRSISDVQIFPNPFNDQLHLQTNKFINGVCTIHDINGQIIYHTCIENKNSFDIKDLTFLPGIYFLRLSDKGFDEMYKLIKN